MWGLSTTNSDNRRHVGICRHLSAFVGICRCLSVFVDICRYLSVFVGICRYLSVFVGICQYLYFTDKTRQFSTVPDKSVFVCICRYWSVFVVNRGHMPPVLAPTTLVNIVPSLAWFPRRCKLLPDKVQYGQQLSRWIWWRRRLPPSHPLQPTGS